MFIADGYITGMLRPRVGECPLCGIKGQRVVDVGTVETPKGFTVEATILFNRQTASIHSAIGLTCGCYAKFHRQVAHIVDSQMAAGRVV